MSQVLLDIRMFMRIFIAVFTMLVFSSLSFGATAPITSLQSIDPEYREAAPHLYFDYTDDEAVKRKQQELTVPAIPSGVKLKKINVPETSDTPAFEMSIYTPRGEMRSSAPLVLMLHGGGFLFRNGYYFYQTFQNLADRLKAFVAVPRYRLSTESPFPSQLLDAAEALKYLYNHGRNIDKRLNTDNILVMGESAGGLLAASLCIFNLEGEKIPVKGQILIYPMLDSRTGTEDSPYRLGHTGEILWPASTNVYAWEKLRGGQVIEEKMLPLFSPALADADSLSGLPPTLIYVGDLDLFVNEDLSYASHLIEAGVDVTVHAVHGLYHCFDYVNEQGRATKKYFEELEYFVRQHTQPLE